MSKAPLDVQNVTKLYGQFCAVCGVSFTIQPGEIFGLLGPNGAGKTTLMSMITSLEAISEGDITVFGHSVKKEPLICKKLFGAVPQEIISHGFFTLEEILHFHSGYYGIYNNKEWLRHIMDVLELLPHKDKKVRQLSGGMRRRLLIAKALVHRPQFLLLDEPTAGVDVGLREILWNFILQLKKDGHTIMVTTHNLSEAEELCDRVAIIDHGKLLRISTAQTLIDELVAKKITLTLKAPFSGASSPYLLESKGKEVVLHAPTSMSLATLVTEVGLAMNDIEDVSIRNGTLEDAFMAVLSKGAKS